MLRLEIAGGTNCDNYYAKIKTTMMMPSPKIGCCGFPVVKEKYAGHFHVVEVQQTFYQPPKISTLQNWRALVPENFEFTLKAWQIITHAAKSPTYRRLKTKLTGEEYEQCGAFQNTPIVQCAWETTRACAKALAARLVLFQCPASFTPTPKNIFQMRRFFTAIERGALKLLWEPRGNWPDDLVLSLCRELNLVHVVDPFLSRPVTTDLIYLRLHGGKDFKHVFSDEELRKVAQLIPADKPAYVMFNNIKMWEDARRFQLLVSSLNG
jgi:uncharacterized protein YecE (DUF72 family)